MKYTAYIFLFLIFISCKPKVEYPMPVWEPYDESEELVANKDHEVGRMQYKLIQSKYLDKKCGMGSYLGRTQIFQPRRVSTT